MKILVAYAAILSAFAVCAADAAANSGASADPYRILLKPIPEKLVVLTFDDSCASHARFVAPLLKKYGLGATFFVSDAFSFRTRKDWYMTWPQIKALDEMGFEIGNHTLGHGQLSATGLDGCLRGVVGIEESCQQNKITKPTTFCWPFYSVNNKFLAVLTGKGYLFARGGYNRPYRPTIDNPLDAPSFSISDTDLGRDKDLFYKAVKQATAGQVVIFTFHGVPDGEHPAVGTDPVTFESYAKYLKDNRYTVIPMRDLAQYVDAAKAAQLLSRPRRFPWGGRGLNWGWVSRKDNRLYVCVEKLPADRKLTLPGMTTKIASAYFLADPKKQPLAISTSGSGIPTIAVPEFSPAEFGEKPTVIVAELQGGPIATILDFTFRGMPPTTISGNRIRANVPLAADRTKLAPIYRTGSPLVTGKPASGSVNNFTTPQTYTIAAPDGTTKDYVVTVVPTAGVVGVSNPSFEMFDVLNEQDDTFGRNPSGAVWAFQQAKPGDEVGINLVNGGPIFAPPAPGGTRHSAFMRGAGNGISQSIAFDAGKYTVSFDLVKRNGYGDTPSPLTVSMDGAPVFNVPADRITDAWHRYTSPAFSVASGTHRLAFTLDKAAAMDLIDNVAVAKAARE